MPRRQGDVQIQLSVGPTMRRALGIAALKHEESTPKIQSGNREVPMDRGRMIVFVMRWFLSRPPEEQLRVIKEGLRLSTADSAADDLMEGRDVDVVIEEVEKKAQPRETKPLGRSVISSHRIGETRRVGGKATDVKSASGVVDLGDPTEYAKRLTNSDPETSTKGRSKP